MLAQEVFIPLLCNPSNQAGWPEMVTREVMDNLYKFSASACVTVGLAKGQTLLPVPPVGVNKKTKGGGSAKSSHDSDARSIRPSDARSVRPSNESVRSSVMPRLTKFSEVSESVASATMAVPPTSQNDAEMIHVVESAVVLWTHQIKNVLRTDPEQPLKDGHNPGPIAEIEFWKKKAATLNAIRDQLASAGIQRAIDLLKSMESTFYPAFERLCVDVETAATEANSNTKFLGTLEKQFERLSLGDDYAALPEQFLPMFHLVLLVWRHSPHYNTPARLVVLVREMCNDVIGQSVKACESGTLFDSPPHESAEKLRAAVRVCTAFRAAYDSTAARSLELCPANPWRVPAAAVFSRFDAFVERCTDLMDLFNTASQFIRLERVEVGGTKGRALTASVRSIYADFTSAIARFHLVSYDVMDADNGVFELDYTAFRTSVRELERRLGALIGTALDDSPSLGRTFKMLDSFEGVLERDVVKADLEKKQMALIKSFAAEVKEVQELFTSGRAAPQLSKNAAPASGAVAWTRALLQRVEEPMERLRLLGNALTATPEGVALEAQYTQLVTSFKEAESAIVLEWSARAEETGEERLKQSLLVKDAKGAVSVNFDAALTKLLREVRYFVLQGVEVPPGAAQVFKRSESLRQQTGNLELVAGLYNKAQKRLLPVERPLVERKLENVDAALERGFTVLNWNSPKVDEYIQELMAQVKDLDSVMEQLKGSVEATERILKGWAKKPMFERREGRTYSIDEFRESHRALLAARHAEVSEGAAEIARLINATAKKLLVRHCRLRACVAAICADPPAALQVPKTGSASWKTYMEYVSKIVVVRAQAAKPCRSMPSP